MLPPRPARPSLRLATAVALLAVLVATLAGCTRERRALTIYSGRGQNLVGPLLERFSEETGIPIDVRYGDSADLALLIAEEGERSPADVFLSQSPGAADFLVEKGLLRPLPADLVGLVEEGVRDPEGRWLGVTARQRVLVYNERLVEQDELPASVFELTEPRFRGQVGVAPENASFQDFVTAMRRSIGNERTLEWLRGLARNDAQTYQNNNAIVAAVGRGEIRYGLANHYYNYRFLEEDPSLPSRNHVFPGGNIGSLLIVSSVAIPTATDDLARAQRFVRYLLEEEAQRYFSSETFEYPLASGVEPAAELPPLSEMQLPDLEYHELGGLEETTELIRESGLG